MIEKSVKLAMSDLATIHKLTNNPTYWVELMQATKTYHNLKAYRIDVFYTYQPMIEPLKGFSYEQMEFLSRMEDKEYKNYLIKTYINLTNQQIDEDIIPRNNLYVIKKDK